MKRFIKPKQPQDCSNDDSEERQSATTEANTVKRMVDLLKRHDEILVSCMAEIGSLKRERNSIGARQSQTSQMTGFGNTQVTSAMTSTPSNVVTGPIEEHNINEGQPRS
uniref:Uncharacterized protein n=1 Tax=Glossina pallidipes TaxID=7398 RepID=A0A1A9ZNY8_GLOPL